MRIINQRRDRSVNFDNVEIYIDETRIFASGTQNILLGEYDTEERASEVFEGMHSVFKNDFIYSEYMVPEHGRSKLISERKGPSNAQKVENILNYYMPKS